MALLLLKAPKIGLPKTGQVTSYRAGDDGAIEAGLRGTRFRANTGNPDAGTVYDRHAGLTWVQQPELIIPGATGIHATNQIQVAKGNWAATTAYTKADLIFDSIGGVNYYVCAVAHTSGGTTLANDITAHPTYWRQTVWTASAANLTTPSTMTWNDAIDNSLALEYAGYDDWRLPNFTEIASLSDFSTSAPAIDLSIFPNVASSGDYWSGTTTNANTNYALYMDYYYPQMLIKVKTSDIYVRPVRGGILG